MNFYRQLRALDHQIVGNGLCAIPTGRAYRGATDLYADKIHIFPFGEKLQKFHPAMSGGLYMGTAGLINFGHLAKIKPSHAILFDVNPFQTIFWNVVISMVHNNKSYEDFRHALNYSEEMSRLIVARRMEGIKFSSAGSWTQALSNNNSFSRKAFATSATPISFYLDSINFQESDYAFIKSMVDSNNIGTLTLDIFDQQACSQLDEFLQHAHQSCSDIPPVVGSLYLSSVMRFANGHTDWTGRQLKEVNTGGISCLLHPEKSVVIDHQGHYSAASFHDLIRKKKPWLSPFPVPSSKEYVPAYGVAR